MYGYSKKVEMSFNEAIEKTKKELSKEGFGILSEIDVKETLKAKLGVGYDDYVILGACNPPLAYQTLKAEKEIGLLLPCNVIVYKEGGETHVSAVLPSTLMSIVGNDDLKDTAKEVESKLARAIDNV
jgi:uncharacterized protein (DUF302 family)